MSTEPGQQLLHYRIVEKIGEGGMGVVWRAVDTTLDREVAIKLLPDALAADGERVQRFEREARLLASLNHQHIATIHGIHQAPRDDGTPVYFLVMELVEGEDLEARIARGPVPLDRAVEIATQIATALDAAHAQGIVHRDLKPANVKLATNGDVKVLDFGLAKALSNDSLSGDTTSAPSMSPTLTSANTVAGMILGTAAYMSPEQARGKPVDKRADIWAFGCVLFEMLTAKRCFGGETISDTLASVLKEEPDWSQLPAATPQPIRRLLRRCLAKNARQRLSDAADARLELAEAFDPQEVVESASAATVPTEAPAVRKLPWAVAAIATFVAIGAMAAWWFGGQAEPTAAREPLQLSVPIPEGIKLYDDQESLLELSPDGRYLVFSGLDEASSSTSLFLRKLSDDSIVPLPDTNGALNPFFSPDGRWVGFFADSRLKKIQIGVSTAITICDRTGNQRGASWGTDDTIVFPRHFAGGLDRVPASGGTPTPLTQLDTDRKERTHRWPQHVSGHDVVLFTVATTDSPEFYDDARIDAVRLSTGVRTTVFEGASLARYVPTGHLIFARGGFLYGVRFSIDRLEVEGTPVPVIAGVAGAPNSGVVYASISANGMLAFVPGLPESPQKRLTFFHADGRDEPMTGADLGAYIDPNLSPDGKRLAVAMAGERVRDVWVFDLERQSQLRLTFAGENFRPVWTPDGRSLFFTSIREGGGGAAFVVAADGTGGEKLFHEIHGITLVATDLSRDGRLALIEIDSNDDKTDLFVKSLDDFAADAVPFVTGPADEGAGHFSPDGRFVVYHSDTSGDYQVFVRPYPGPGGRWQISSDGGIDPRWSSDGRQIHFRRNRDWLVVDVESGEGGRPFRAGRPRLVRAGLPRAQLGQSYGITTDGTALIVPAPVENAGVFEEVRVVVNWFDDLERIVSAN